MMFMIYNHSFSYLVTGICWYLDPRALPNRCFRQFPGQVDHCQIRFDNCSVLVGFRLDLHIIGKVLIHFHYSH
jgi:hypothetical protein